MGDNGTAGETKGKRRDRLAAALRQNLQRRKEQARARRSGEADTRDEGLPAAVPPEQGEREP